MPRSSPSPSRVWVLEATGRPDAADRDADTPSGRRPVGVRGLAWQARHRRHVGPDWWRDVQDPNWIACANSCGSRICVRASNARPSNARRRTGRDGDALGDRPRRRSAATAVVDRDDRHRSVQSPVPDGAGTVIAPGLMLPGCPMPTSNVSSTTRPTATSPRPAGAASPGPCGASSKSATNTANTPAATNPWPAATSITSSRAATAGSPVCATGNCCARTTTASTRPPPDHGGRQRCDPLPCTLDHNATWTLNDHDSNGDDGATPRPKRAEADPSSSTERPGRRSISAARPPSTPGMAVRPSCSYAILDEAAFVAQRHALGVAATRPARTACPMPHEWAVVTGAASSAQRID